MFNEVYSVHGTLTISLGYASETTDPIQWKIKIIALFIIIMCSENDGETGT